MCVVRNWMLCSWGEPLYCLCILAVWCHWPGPNGLVSEGLIEPRVWFTSLWWPSSALMARSTSLIIASAYIIETATLLWHLIHNAIVVVYFWLTGTGSGLRPPLPGHVKSCGVMYTQAYRQSPVADSNLRSFCILPHLQLPLVQTLQCAQYTLVGCLLTNRAGYQSSVM